MLTEYERGYLSGFEHALLKIPEAYESQSNFGRGYTVGYLDGMEKEPYLDRALSYLKESCDFPHLYDLVWQMDFYKV